MTDVGLHKVSYAEKQVLENMIEYYVYDFSEFLEIELGDQGKFGFYSLEAYWSDPAHHHPFFIRADNKLIGFALVKIVDADNGVELSMDEFFITKRYRRRGCGESAAKQLFDRFGGKWRIRQIANNLPAQKFWTKIISAYTNGQFEDEWVNGRRRQTFLSPAR